LANNFEVILHVRQTFFGGIDSSRRKGAFARGNIQDDPECRRGKKNFVALVRK
jgi:hypothetical protein